MRCPRDGSELTPRVYEADVEIDACSKCHGSFLDQGELERIQMAVEKDHRRDLLSDVAGPLPRSKPVDSMHEEFEAEREEARPLVDCPKCGKQMERRRYGFGSQTVIDVCVEGDGIWLDAGELQELERFYERSQDETQIPITWRLWAAVRSRLGGGAGKKS